jgi:orotate phosphoribosyltransferase
MQDLRRDLARLLKEKSYREGDFTLTSGRKSDYYFDCKQTALHPEGAWLLGRLFLELLQDYAIKGVGGMTLGRGPVGQRRDGGLAYRGPAPARVHRAQAAQGPRHQPVLEGMANFAPGDKVVLLEDVVTTGGTLLTALERVRAEGLDVVGVLCVLDREEGGRDNLARAGYKLTSIFTRSELLHAAAQ